jgi:hypothetical protein
VLAYGFWHWKRDEVTRERYESAQRAFLRALAADPPPGFLGGTTARLAGAPWAAGGGPAYEDWYRVTDMAALEALNSAAVSGSREDPHQAVARLALGGIAGLYGLRGGSADPPAGAVSWFAKPEGMSYATLDGLLAPLLAAGGASLWSRRMTLGPTPEFCLRSAAPVPLPSTLCPTHSFALEPL